MLNENIGFLEINGFTNKQLQSSLYKNIYAVKSMKVLVLIGCMDASSRTQT